MKPFTGIIIEESLTDTSVLKKVRIISTLVEPVVDKHKTPWIRQWTMHTVEIKNEDIDQVAKELSVSIDTSHNAWYADFKNETIHYIIYSKKVFKVNRDSADEYAEASRYGISIGIPDYQVDFTDVLKK